VQGNEGIVAIPQGDAASLASEIAHIADDAARFERLSNASVDAAHRALSYDFGALYRGVATGTLPPEFSPEPTLDDAGELLRLMVFFAERSRGGRSGAGSRGGSARSARLWEAAAPLGRATLQRFPGLRPLAHNMKKRLLGR